MSGTLPTPPVCVIDAAGIYGPSFEECLAYFQDGYRTIYGTDVYLGNDSPDGQLMQLFATALNDANAMAVAVYNAFSPATAQGVGLSNNVKINGLSRNPASQSQVDVTLAGAAFTVVANGIVADSTGGVYWDLPASVEIGAGGTVVATATCRNFGQVRALANTITRIITPVSGWLSVTNVNPASLGEEVETDAQLRIRQNNSVALPSLTVLEGLAGALQTLDGVTTLRIYENFTGATDALGIPEHSIATVIEGGDVDQIAETIYLKKTPGTGTAGSTTIAVVDSQGFSVDIKFSRPTIVNVWVGVTIAVTGLTGYTSDIGLLIAEAVKAYVDSLGIGGDRGEIRRTRLYVPAQLSGPFAPGTPEQNALNAATFELTTIKLANGTAGPGAETDLTIAYNQIAKTYAVVISVVG